MQIDVDEEKSRFNRARYSMIIKWNYLVIPVAYFSRQSG